MFIIKGVFRSYDNYSYIEIYNISITMLVVTFFLFFFLGILLYNYIICMYNTRTTNT